MPGRGDPSPRKIEKVDDLKETISGYPNVGVLNMHKMPAAQLGKMRKSLSEHAKIVMGKKILIERALPDKLSDLKEYLKGQPALILSDMNPFKLFKTLEKKKTSAPAKVGDIAPEDIVVPAGDTGIPPGPAIGTFGSANVVASVKDGSIHILKDTVMVKEGEEISREAAQVLGLLNIEPMRVGLDMVAMYEDGTVFDKSLLRIDEDEFNISMQRAIQHSINLSVESGYMTKVTAPMVITKLARHVRSLCIEAGIYSPTVMPEILGKAQRQANAISSLVPASTPQPEEAAESQSSESEEAEESQDDNSGGAE